MTRTMIVLIGLIGLITVQADEPKSDAISGTGRVVAVRRASITANAPGVITQVMVTEGQLVKKGELLFRLDPRALELDMKRAEIQTEIARVKLDQLRIGVSEEVRKVARAEIARAEAGVKAAETDYARLKKLHERGAVSVEELTRAEAMLQGAKAELEKQFASLKVMEAGAPKTELAIASLAVEAARVELDRAKLALNATTIFAPFDGVVHRLGAEPGTYTNPAMTGVANTSTLCEILDISAPRIEATLPETAFFRLRSGAPCLVKVASLDKTFEGSIERISPIVERGLITVRVKLAGDGAVPLGVSARVEVIAK